MRKPIEFTNHPVAFPAAPTYRAFCRYVVDGDTVDLLVDLGLYQYGYVTVRVADINTPEMNSRDAGERARAVAAKQFLIELVHGKQCLIQTRKDVQTFGRFVAAIVIYEGEHNNPVDVATRMVEAGHAVWV